MHYIPTLTADLRSLPLPGLLRLLRVAVGSAMP